MEPCGADTNGNHLPGTTDAASRVRRAASAVVDGSTLRLADRYWLEEPIGEGPTTTVWRAWDELLAQPVAIRTLSPSTVLGRAARSRLQSRVRQLARLSHPGLAAVHDLAEATGPDGDEVTFVVMELLEGETLAARLRRGPLPWREAARICATVASALAVLHEAGIPHGEVRPSRIFLSDGGARLAAGLRLDPGPDLDPGPNLDPTLETPPAALTGPPSSVPASVPASSGPGAAPPAGPALPVRPARSAYEAPERRRIRRRASPADLAAADVYALGAVLTETITGDPAHVAPPPEVPDEVAALCLRCLAHDRSERPSATEVADVLKAAPARARRATRGRSFARPLARWPGRAAARRGPSASLWQPPPPEVPAGSRRGVRRRSGVVIGLSAALVGGVALTVAAIDSPPDAPLATWVRPAVTAPGMSWLTAAPEPPAGPSPGPAERGGVAPRISAPERPTPSASGPPSAEDPNRPSRAPVAPTWPRPGEPPGRERTLRTLAAARYAVDQGVSAREIRSDVGLDLDNVIVNLWNDVISGRVIDARPRTLEIQNKIVTRLRERGLTYRQAERLTAILSGITGTPAHRDHDHQRGDGDHRGRDGYRYRDDRDRRHRRWD